MNSSVRELRFGARKDGSREVDLRNAEMLMFLARNEVISIRVTGTTLRRLLVFLGADADTPHSGFSKSATSRV
jgi:hypothetical protein